MNEEKLKMYLTILNDENPSYVKENAKTNIIILFEKQQKEIKARLEEIDCLYKFISIREERIDELVEINEKYNDLYISKDEIRHIRDKAECMDYYSLNDVIDDLTKLIGDENNE